MFELLSAFGLWLAGIVIVAVGALIIHALTGGKSLPPGGPHDPGFRS